MFGGRFSMTRFSMRPGGMDFDARIIVFFAENMHNMVSLGQESPFEADFRDRFRADVMLTRGVKTVRAFRENTGVKISGVRNYNLRAEYIENISSDVYLASNLNIPADFEGNVTADIYLSKNSPFGQSFRENIDADVFLGKNVPFDVYLTESVLGVVHAGFVDEDIFVIDVTIPPGGELRIDSEMFTAKLDGESVIHRHFGDWVNISRDTLEIIVSSSAQLDGQILFMERFL